MTGPVNDPPPGGPGRERPLDPNSPKGREVAERLTATLARLEAELAEREAAGRGVAA